APGSWCPWGGRAGGWGRRRGGGAFARCETWASTWPPRASSDPPHPSPLPDGKRERRGLVAWPQAEQVTHRVDQVGAVHGVEVKVGDAAIDEIEHLFGGDRGGDELARGGILVEALEPLGEPVGHRRAAARGKRLGLLEVLHRQDAGHDRHVDAACAHAIEVAEVEVVLEEELGDRACGAGIDLGREHGEVGLNRGAVRRLFRIGGDRHLDVGEALDAGDQVGSVAIAAGMGRVAIAGAADGIPAQRHDVAHAGATVVADHRVDLLAGRGDAGEMSRRGERSLRQDALDGRVRALARGAARAVGDRDEIRLERRKAGDRVPQRLFHLLGLRREELEGDADAALPAIAEALDEAAGARLGLHHATSRAGAASVMRGSRPSQSETAILPSEAGSGAKLGRSTAATPAAFIHCVTVSGAKPRRRWACSSRRNSRSWGAKSTTSKRPAGRSTRAASWIARAPSSRKCSTWWMTTASKVSLGSARS